MKILTNLESAKGILRKPKTILILLSSIVFFALFGIITYEATKAEITITVDDKESIVYTHANTVEDLLNKLDIELGTYDEVSPEKDTLISDGMEVNYKKAKEVTVTIEDKSDQYYTTANTVEEFLRKAGIHITDQDRVTPGRKAAIEKGLNVQITPAIQVTIQDGENEQKVWTTSDTVSALLEQEKVKLSEFDRISPELDSTLKEDATVKITRVEKVTDVVEEPIDYAVEKQKDSSLTRGKEKVIQQGEKGLVTKTYEVTLENGVEVERKLVEEEIKKESKTQIVAVGTKEPFITVSRSDSEFSMELSMVATAYTEKCNGCRGITYTGIDLRNRPDAKVVAVDPKVIPLGTKVWVEGYGNAIAADIGGAIKGNRIDLFYHSSVYRGGYGMRNVKVKVYK
ncbi:ubiquitin-like domain-containing protein [Bacillaceae bacterium S4-13-58]